MFMVRAIRLSSMAMALAAVVIGSSPVWAATVIVTDRPSLNANDLLDWEDLGVASNTTGLANPFTLATGGGMLVNVAKPGGGFHYFEQAAPAGPGFPPFWVGNFDGGDSLLNDVGAGSITLTFADLVSAAGANIMPNYGQDGGTFIARIQAFDINGAEIASFTTAGVADGARDGSAPFIGVASTAFDIKSVTFSIAQFPVSPYFGGVDFSINEVSITTEAANAIPEPATAGLLALAAAGTLLRRRAR